MANRRLVKTVSFPARSKPHMLRVSPDGKEVWVQTGEANTNVVLDASDLSVLSTEPTGKQPVTNAWTRDRRYSVVTNGQDTFAQIFDARTFKEVKRLTIGEGGSNIGFSRDGRTTGYDGCLDSRAHRNRRAALRVGGRCLRPRATGGAPMSRDAGHRGGRARLHHRRDDDA